METPVKFYSTLCIILFWSGVQAQTPQFYADDSVMVTAQRFPVSLADISRSVVILDSLDLHASPASSFQDALGYALGLDLQRRGPFGVQAEASIRGASFEGTKILVDGISLNDAQTAHHNLNIPLALADIERIEILRGGNSGVHGADAVGGVINIITKTAGKTFALDMSGGQFGFMNTAARMSKSGDNWQHSISFENRRSDGYMPNSAFDMLNLFYKLSVEFKRSSAQFMAGFNDKQFDAGAFYSSLFPNEWEHTKTAFLSASWNRAGRAWKFSPVLSYRRHFDDFILDNNRPDWYRNIHTTHSFAVSAPMQWRTTIGNIAAAMNLKQDWLASKSLGEHQRQYLGFSLGLHKVLWGRLDVSFAAFSSYYSDWGWQTWPGIDVGYRMGRFKLFVSSQSAFRIPSFTELYYQSPGNIGNPNLRYEESRTDEAGMKFNSMAMSASIGLFRRSGANVIDWVRGDDDDPWRVENIGTVRATGFEAQASFYQLQSRWIDRITAHYSYISADRNNAPFQSKYALRYLRHSLQLGFVHTLPLDLQARWMFQVRQRIHESRYALLGCRLSKTHGQWQFYIKATNLLDVRYHDFIDVPMPGRWLVIGLKRVWD